MRNKNDSSNIYEIFNNIKSVKKNSTNDKLHLKLISSNLNNIKNNYSQIKDYSRKENDSSSNRIKSHIKRNNSLRLIKKNILELTSKDESFEFNYKYKFKEHPQTNRNSCNKKLYENNKSIKNKLLKRNEIKIINYKNSNSNISNRSYKELNKEKDKNISNNPTLTIDNFSKNLRLNEPLNHKDIKPKNLFPEFIKDNENNLNKKFEKKKNIKENISKNFSIKKIKKNKEKSINKKINFIYEDNNDFILKFILNKNKKSISIDCLNTKKISKENEMYSNSFDICDILNISEFSEKLDTIKILKDLFNKNPPIGIFNKKPDEFFLKITYENNIKNTFVLNKKKCKDNEFINKNISKKFKQYKIEKIKKIKEFYEEYKNMIEDNKNLENKTGIKIEINKNLSEINNLFELILLELKKIK